MITIIGAGPAGLIAAHELNKKNIDFRIIEKGRRVNYRNGNLLNGIGGAGLYSDGKLNFHPLIGGKPLEVMSKKEYWKSLKKLSEILKIKINKNKMTKTQLTDKAVIYEFDQYHFGSDKLPNVIKNICSRFENQIIVREEVENIKNANNGFVVETNKNQYFSKEVVIAVGQTGLNLVKNTVSKFGKNTELGNIGIGIRIEFPAKIFKPLANYMYDPKIYFNTPNTVRTFCANPNGSIVLENKNGFFCVNGHSYKDFDTPYTNMALMQNLKNKNPHRFFVNLQNKIQKKHTNIITMDTNHFLGKKSNNFKKTIQEASEVDFHKIFRKKVNKSWEITIKELEKILPGLKENSRLYAPEIKYHHQLVHVEKNTFKLRKGIYVLGNAIGKIHGLTNAFLSGISYVRNNYN